MPAEIKGMPELIKKLEKKYGQQAIRRVSDDALREGAKVFMKELKEQLATFKDLGYEYDEVVADEPATNAEGNRYVKIHWEGPHDRWRLIHLNENGTVQNPDPRGKGKIAAALINSEKAYHNAIRDALKRGL
jgi:hypothetical protein